MSRKNIETINSLSPVQQGMLYETVRAPASGIYIEQSMYTLTGKLDVAAFERAWQWGVNRHAILRTGFVWKEHAEPFQVTLRQVSMALDCHDLREVSPAEQHVRIEDYLMQERTRGFELSRPPLMRLALLRLDEQTSCLIWTFHHILMDGWSVQVLLNEIISCYTVMSRGQDFHLKASRPYNDYIRWLKAQDISLAEEFWRNSLRGFTQPTRLGREVENGAVYDLQERYGSVSLHLSEAETMSFQAITRRHHLTLSTIVQGVWAILLSRYSGTEDVVFGVTVSGRPVELAGIETMIGLCMNTLPLRVQLPDHVSLWSWFEDLQRYCMDMHAFEYISAGQIHQWSDVPGMSLLYESILVVENYPVHLTSSWFGDVGISVVDAASHGAQTKYVLTFLVTEGARLGIRCVYDASRFERASISQILEHFQLILNVVASGRDVSLATFDSLIQADHIPIIHPPEQVAQTKIDRGFPLSPSPIEEVVATVWGEVLGDQKQIERESNFFEFGGHSLVATQVMSHLRRVLGVEIPLRALFEAPTVARLAQWIEQALHNGEGIQIPPLVVGARPAEIPLSFAQQRLWFLDQLEPESTTYLAPSALSVDGQIWVQALERSLQALIDRHESLRTIFVERAGQPMQFIRPAVSHALPVVDLQGLGPASRVQEARRLAQQEAQHPFDLAKGPLLRTWLLRQEQEAHVLLLTLHHIITDGWSSGVLVRELKMLYHSFVTGSLSPLTPLPVQYADYALWQREWLQGEVLEAQLAYWRTQLAGVSALALPTDAPRPVVQTYQGATESLHLSTALTEQLVALSRQEQVTLFMTLLASFQVLLMHYSGQSDISVGTPIANRRHADLEGVIGFFANTLVLRTDLSGNPSFIELLQRVREVCLRAYAHQDVPFEKVVEALEPERDLSRSPLFQVMLVLQNMPQERGGLDEIRIEPLDVARTISKFDLTFSLVETEQGLYGALEYNIALFEAGTIRRLLGHWQTLLEELVRDPLVHVTAASLLTDEERERLLVAAQGTQSDLSQQCCIPQLFERQVERTPDAVALVFEEQSLTYRELDRRANQLAHHLQGMGVGPEVLVGVCLERSIEMVLGLLGVFKAGGAYVPLDPTYPAERLAFMIEDAHLTHLLTQQGFEEQVPASVARVLVLKEAWKSLSEQPEHNPVSRVSPEHLAYVIYTSGSTGQPKGVAITHASATKLLQWSQTVFHGLDVAGVLASTSICFDLSIFELFVPLSQGGTIILVQNLLQLPATPAAEYVTLINTVPSVLREFLRLNVLPASVRVVNLAGEPLPPSLVAQIYQYETVQRIFNLYGPTEDTTYSTVALMQRDSTGPVTIGRPIAGSQAYVLDRYFMPVPIGVIGNLYLAGDGLARGYLKRSSLTAERFVPHPFSSVPGARLYSTGDLARYRENGEIEYLGRADHQIKLHGFRIELGEVEAALRTHPTVQDAIVALYEEHELRSYLVAYLVLDLLRAEVTRQPVPSPLIAERLKHWQELYDETYRQELSQTVQTFNTAGWNSSYTGQRLAEEEMRAWREDTLALVRSYQPERLWEIGCGAGLLLFPLSSTCMHYYGTDFSAVVLEGVRQQLAYLKEESGLQPAVTLWQQQANDFSRVPEEPIDTILINSVLQDFPDVDYLLSVLEGAVHLVAPGGRIIVGDVRSLPLLEAFHADVQLVRAAETMTRQQLWQHVQQQVQQEKELVLDPAFFRRWAQTTGRVSRVEVRLKRGRYHNELIQFRYQVVLHVGEPLAARRTGWQQAEELNWSAQAFSRERLCQKLSRERPERLRLRQVPNARVEQAVQTLHWLKGESGAETVGAWQRELRTRTSAGVEPEDLWEDAERLGYHLTINWEQHQADGCYSVLLQRMDGEWWNDAEEELLAPTEQKERVPDWQRFANQPLRGETERQLVPQIQQHLQERLPSHMLPSAFVLLDALPLTSNGKVDRRALPIPDLGQEQEHKVVQGARTPIEELLMAVWSEVLGRRRVGVHENFFDLGGHSLLATQLIGRVKAQLKVEIPLRTLFEVPTVAGLARRVEQALERREGMHVSPPLVAGVRPAEVPLSFAQQRLWFLDQLEPESTIYLVPTALSVDGQIQVQALERSLQALIDRHESLRTTFAERTVQPIQIIHPVGTVSVPVIDLQRLRPERRELEAQWLASQELQCPFDLVSGPLLRMWLVRQEQEAHVLLLTLHHIITDGWSNEVLVYELTTLYRSFVTSSPSPLAPLPLQYADYALWQREWLQGEVLEAQLAYWRTQLAGASALALPTDVPRPMLQTYRGAVQSLHLSTALTEQLVALSRHEQVTLFMTLLASFQVLLMRYSGQSDICVGTPIANRRQAELEGVIGFFVNTLVLRTDIAGNPSFVELLQRVREVCLGAYAHQDVPFEKVVEAVGPERDLSRPPLFQVMLVLQNMPQERGDLDAIRIEPLDVEHTISKFDLSMIVRETEQGLHVMLEYNSDLFEAQTIQRMLSHWQMLLEEVLHDPHRPVTEVPLLSAIEQTQVLQPWTASPDAQWQQCGHHIFEQRVLQAPDAVALVFNEHQLTYDQLNCRANQLAHYLQGLGVGPEVLVGLCLERSLEMVIGLLAVFKAGGAYVPLDPTYPQERLAFLQQDAQLSLVLTQQRLEHLLPASAAQKLVWEQVWPTLARYSDALPANPIGLDNLAYLIYTSGSTGRPKGVLLSHRGLGNLVRGQVEAFAVGAGSRVLQFSSLNFDISVWELMMSLLSGASLHLGRSEQLLPGPDLLQLLREQAISVLTLPPPALAVLPIEPLPALEYLIVGGEPCPVAVMRRWAEGRHFFNGYGPTEVTVCASLIECSVEQITHRSLSLGRPLAGTQLYLLDGSLQPVPAGVIGELYLGGAGLARGYKHLPAQTAERFVPHPFSAEPGQRLYRTGDLARYAPDGHLEFMGRLDQQVKIRGYRIELGEIEAALGAHPTLQEAVVLVREDLLGEKSLVAYVVGKSGESLTSSALRSFLQSRLPSYMIPAVFVFLNALPLMPNGKVDRKILLALSTDRNSPLSPLVTVESTARTIVLPRDEMEWYILQVWEEILEMQPISVVDNFFNLGGHSLLGMRLMSQLGKQLGQKLSLVTLFQHPTIEELSVALRQCVRSGYESPLIALQPLGTRPPFFCVHPLSATAFVFINLVRGLGLDQPFYGFHTPDQSSGETTLGTVEDLAAYYLAAIRTVQPQGPYLLGGWSAGGTIALEIAQQLYEQGDEVDMLAIFDSKMVSSQEREKAIEEGIDFGDAAVARAILNYFNIVIPADFDQRESDEQLIYAVEQARQVHAIPTDADVESVSNHIRAEMLNKHIAHLYAHQSYKGRIDYFAARGSVALATPLDGRESMTETEQGQSTISASQQDDLQDWRKLAKGGLEVHPVPGNHFTMVDEPNVQVLANVLKRCIDRVYDL